MSVFVDTSALIPLLVRTDPDHASTLATFKDLTRKGRLLLTSSYVIVETTAVLQARIGLDPVRDLHEAVLPVMTVTWVDKELHGRGTERLFREDRRRLSLVDCVSFEIMEAAGTKDAFSLDSHFRDAGFRMLPE